MIRILVLSLVFSTSALAQSNSDTEKYYTITNVKTEEIPYNSNAELKSILMDSAKQLAEVQKDVFWQSNLLDVQNNPFANISSDGVGDVIGAIGNVPAIAADPQLAAMVKVGQAVWKVVVDNKPVINAQWSKMSVLPEGLQDWTKMVGWSAPQSKVYKVVYTNGFGIDVVTLSYRVLYSFGGSYKGAGKYLANVSLQPIQVTVAWGFTLDAAANSGTVQNMGTEQSPIASTELTLNYSVKTPFTADERQEVFHVRGDGGFQKLN